MRCALYCGTGSLLFAVLSFLTCVICPACIGSGVPGIMAYLNGVHQHRLLSTSTGNALTA